MNIQTISKAELRKLKKSLEYSIYKVGCYSPKDIRQLLDVDAELRRREEDEYETA